MPCSVQLLSLSYATCIVRLAFNFSISLCKLMSMRGVCVCVQVVKAGESTSFDVVFLARMTGSARNLLYIQSSQGTFEYEVRARGCVCSEHAITYCSFILSLL